MASVRRELPSRLRGLFWDYALADLRWDRDQDLILGRLLAVGGWPHVRILRSRFGDGRIREWITRRGGRGLSPQRIRFWALILKLPGRQADAWVRAAQRSPWGQRRGR